MDLLDDLKYRGLLNQVTDIDGLRKAMDDESLTLYCGFDPTGDSLHIGNLLMIVTLRRFQEHGHKPIGLVGGGTGLIGDPSGRNSERQLNEEDVVVEWGDKIKGQLSKYLDFDRETNPAEVKNNYEWLGGLSLVEFLRDTGKHFPLNYMLAKESVTSRMDAGISFTEFTYMMLQAYDFLNLYEKENCRLQIGGSDQWGNITAGLELIRRMGHEEERGAFGLTVPLITKADGTKFGKTAGGAIWLDPDKTSAYEFYQFWINADDRDVIPLIKYFTFLDHSRIEALEKAVASEPEKRAAQKTLAREMTRFVHGEAALEQAEHITDALFKGELKALNAEEIRQGFKDVPHYRMPSRDDSGLIDALVESGVDASKRQAREDIKNGAIYINGERVTDLAYELSAKDRIEDEYIIIRRGKKKYFLLEY